MQQFPNAFKLNKACLDLDFLVYFAWMSPGFIGS